MSRMGQYLAVDVGGTHIRVALYPVEGIVPIKSHRIRTAHKKSTPLQRLTDLIQETLPENKNKVRAIGLAVPGYVDPAQGVVILAPNVPGWDYLPIRSIIEEKFHIPVAVGNDANLAAMGEWKYGAARGYHDVLYLTISTGIGGGVIIHDKLLTGARGLAGELGHVVIDPDGPLCGCGHPGHIESFSAGPAIAQWVKDQLKKGVRSILSNLDEITSLEISRAAGAGDDLAKKSLERAAGFLGSTIADYLHIFNPEVLILGGGVSRSGKIFTDALMQSIHRNVISIEYVRDLKISIAQLGDDAGLVGALALARSTK